MKLIPLTQGQFAKVDDSDYGWLMQWKWQARLDENRTWYASRQERCGGGRTEHTPMPRAILGLPKGSQVDHIDHDGLNNQRRNLRPATSMQNSHNRKPRRTNTYSRFKGITWHKRVKQWEARINVDHKPIALGYFNSEVAAAKEYDKAALYYFGEYAQPNFPLRHYNHAKWSPRPARIPTSHFMGVMQRHGSNRWSATIYFHHQGRFLGYFDSEREAAEIHDIAMRCYFGDGAKTNFPLDNSRDLTYGSSHN